jgi:phosphoribosylaminoimidazolecarboxamide formyltransferase/IMP cyclohydrolase
MPIARALLSVSDKQGLTDFARALERRGVELLSTGGTAQALRNAGIAVREVADYTGFPEIMGGRVKTLHPRVHGGLLGRRGTDEAVMAEHGIGRSTCWWSICIPSRPPIARPDCTYAEAIENIDVGGPAMLRARPRIMPTSPWSSTRPITPRCCAELEASGDTSIDTRSRLAAKAYAHTAAYDTCVSGYLQRASNCRSNAFRPRCR